MDSLPSIACRSRYSGTRSGRVHRTTAESLVRAYKHEAQRQRLMVKKAKICEARLRSVSAALKKLVRDEDYVTLLRAEKMESMPKFLAELARTSRFLPPVGMTNMVRTTT